MSTTTRISQIWSIINEKKNRNHNGIGWKPEKSF